MESLSSQMTKMTKDIKQLKESVQRVQSKLDQIEEKKSDGGHLQKQIDDIQKSVSRLMSGGGGKADSDAAKFKQWLEGTVGMGEYYDLFVENGVEKLSVVQMFTMKELSMIGISKIGHRMMLTKAIEMLNQRD